MRVNYSLRSRDLTAVAAEAAWAESMGYDGVSSNETAHDPFLPLTLAATSSGMPRSPRRPDQPDARPAIVGFLKLDSRAFKCGLDRRKRGRAAWRYAIDRCETLDCPPAQTRFARDV